LRTTSCPYPRNGNLDLVVVSIAELGLNAESAPLVEYTRAQKNLDLRKMKFFQSSRFVFARPTIVKAAKK
jgi:hypothetical protein